MIGISQAKHKSFPSLHEARVWVAAHGVNSHTEDLRRFDDVSAVDQGEGPFYAVANGTEPGIYGSYA